MAQKTVVELVDDLDGEATGSVETVHFGLHGTSYEIDLGPANLKELEAALAPYIAVGRTAASRPRASNGRASNPVRISSASDRDEIQAIRVWGRQNGFTVSERGRLGKDVIEAYRAAH